MVRFLSLCIALLVAGPAAANDSSAELAAGGLRLTHNAHIRMEAEDLYISRQRVRVSYVFRNLSGEPQTVLVAFPLPEIDSAELGDGDVGITSRDPVNFVDFSVTVDGAPRAYEVNERASLFGLDVTETLRRAGLPLNPMADRVWEKILALPEPTQQALAADGLVTIDGDFALPLWRYAVVFYWRQSFFTEGAQVKQFCIEPPFARAAANKKKRMGEGAYPTIYWVSYILTTGANWAGPIGRFHLTVDKGRSESLVSLCRDGIEKTGPATFEWQASDYWPETDLKVLFVD
jgi:hypothetical protein